MPEDIKRCLKGLMIIGIIAIFIPYIYKGVTTVSTDLGIIGHSPENAGKVIQDYLYNMDFSKRGLWN